VSETCIVCHGLIIEGQNWARHQRLGISFHTGHDLTDIDGNDMTNQTLMWYFAPDGATE
jgi:hypothetical protein